MIYVCNHTYLEEMDGFIFFILALSWLKEEGKKSGPGFFFGEAARG